MSHDDQPEQADQARQHAVDSESPPQQTFPEIVETAWYVRCPHCQARTEVHDNPSRVEIECAYCGHPFEIFSDEASSVPKRLGRFELMEKLGGGSFGTVWRARDSTLDRDVALKVPRRTGMTASEMDEVMREARAAAKLRHRHIVAVHEVGCEGDAFYIVSDLIPGVTLQQWADSQPMNLRQTADLCRVIAEALHHAHQAGIVHRDLKPANILMDEQGEPHLTDFGLAKFGSEEVAMTMHGRILGTPAYMSPEQARGEAHRCDGRSDVYSLGVILFELLTDELPFRGNMSVLPQKIMQEDPPSPRQLNRHIPLDLETICLKCLQKSPQRRYQSGREVAQDIQHWLDGEPIQARPIGPSERLVRWLVRHPITAGFAFSSLAVLILMTILLLTMVPIWQSRLEAEKSQIQQQSERVLRDVKSMVLEAARAAAADRAFMQELEAEFQHDAPVSNAASQAFLKTIHGGTEVKLDYAIDLVNWFVLDRSGVLRASTDPEAGRPVVGKNFSSKAYFKAAVPHVASVTIPYPSQNDGLYKVPVSTMIVDQGHDAGILVLAVSTPGTKALDDQRRFIHDLIVGGTVCFSPLALFLVVSFIVWSGRRLRRPSRTVEERNTTSKATRVAESTLRSTVRHVSR